MSVETIDLYEKNPSKDVLVARLREAKKDFGTGFRWFMLGALGAAAAIAIGSFGISLLMVAGAPMYLLALAAVATVGVAGHPFLNSILGLGLMAMRTPTILTRGRYWPKKPTNLDHGPW